MWQRVQTLYLAISTILIAVMLFSNEAVCLGADGAVADAIRFTDKVSHLIMLIIILLLNFMALTIVKHRVFQMRTAVLAAIITLALQIWIVLDYFSIHEVYVFKLPAIFPVVCIILDVLAARAILADQLLVESSGSLRKSRAERRKGRK
ncbi:MAG: DUF4293 family protein [Bacteroidales bacterium]|nr:DUF4293 family protein [Bacteroidales bacterium]MBQ8461233.1 DUF4293 family protein [Bacteroidales bacterium]MCR5364247.1 DUF4293 domain-containing protein [Bacteroidales bacterium]